MGYLNNPDERMSVPHSEQGVTLMYCTINAVLAHIQKDAFVPYAVERRSFIR